MCLTEVPLSAPRRGASSTGSLAEYCLAEEEASAPLPPGVSFADAACLPIAACAALQQLSGLKPGQTVVLLGASGGVVRRRWAQPPRREAREWARCPRPALDLS